MSSTHGDHASTAPSTPRSDEPTVCAVCSDCDSTHPLSQRTYTDDSITTTCPNCNSTSYRTESSALPLTVSERTRIVVAVQRIPGIGTHRATALGDAFEYFVDLRSADVSTLTDTPGIGDTLANRLTNTNLLA